MRGNQRLWTHADRANLLTLADGLILETEEVIRVAKDDALKDSTDGFKDAAEEEQWLAAMREAVKLNCLQSDLEVLAKVQKMGMTGDGELLQNREF